MIIKRFRAEDLHGYLKFDLKFDTKLTFLTGINGCGKTTVLQSIVALISPSLYVLGNLNFRFLEVTLIENKKSLKIKAERFENTVTLSAHKLKEKLTFDKYVSEPDQLPGRNVELEAEYYHNLISKNSNHPIIKLINDLPTPMFLDLERRAREPLSKQASAVQLIRASRRGRNIFSPSLSQSLLNAAFLAENVYRQSMSKVRELERKLRTEMVLGLLDVAKPTSVRALSLGRQAILETIKKIDELIPTLPGILELPPNEIDRRFTPFVNNLREIVNDLPDDRTSKQGQAFWRNLDRNQSRAILAWSRSNSEYERLKRVIELVEQFNEDKKAHLKTTALYLSFMNRFFNDSQKVLLFDGTGELVFSQPDKQISPITALSSGEVQILVILTHLLFNPAAQQANVFMIDEPELSLHIHWQELFVDSVVQANPNVQFMMATHSPSIISSRTDNAIDLSGKVPGVLS